MNVTVKTYIGTIFLENIDSFNINECELSIIFTDILCILPEHLRDNIHIQITK